MNTDETPLEAMYRELREETGLEPDHVAVLGVTPGWLRYRLPPAAIRRHDRLVCIGQKQVWFLLQLHRRASPTCASTCTDNPSSTTGAGSISGTRWTHVVIFKRGVYARRCAIWRRSPADRGPQAICSRSPTLRDCRQHGCADRTALVAARQACRNPAAVPHER